HVTRPDLPPLEEFNQSLQQIWENKWLTNKGPFHDQFEKELAAYLRVPYISLFSNGTLALMIALRALDIKGEVITTPYSFVATTHALWWNGTKPVFVDIEPEYGNLDPDKIEAAITQETTAILPVHVYGNPCDTEKIQKVADKHGLKVIYDAAHAFGVEKNGQSILNFGDLSVLSFHATKSFNTIEGGAIVCHDPEIKKQIDYLKNFGFENETTVVGPGINAKMNELQAAYGLLQLKEFNNNTEKRKKLTEIYRQELQNVKGVSFMPDMENVKHNYSYFPVFIGPDYSLSRDSLYEKLKENNIFARRYFYPLISEFPPYNALPSAKQEFLPNAQKMAEQVICLPLYSEITEQALKKTCNVITKQNG
ncbi:MAG: DegT/DnrJ/EryC1/StrS family aminotransferase, partial [Bacteroidetes bacterium]